MFKHLLLPTDGSPMSETVIHKGIELARENGARLTAIHVVPPFHTFTWRTEMLEDTAEQYERDSRDRAERHLRGVEREASDAGVACDTVCATADHPYQAIIDAATARDCDLIMMASHGRHGMQAVLLGSETQKVLHHANIPVLVYRGAVAA